MSIYLNKPSALKFGSVSVMKIAGEHFTDAHPFHIEPVTLSGLYLRLEPLTEAHIEELAALIDPEIWRWYTVRVTTRAEFESFMRKILEEQARGLTVAFAIRDTKSGELIGSSRFLHLDAANRRLEIGSTWFAPKWQRTYANSEAKFLMLEYAFDVLSCIAVQFLTDALNEKSRRAIERLGAKLDGVVRAQRICYDGRIRNSALYSITADEWPAVRHALHEKLRA